MNTENTIGIFIPYHFSSSTTLYHDNLIFSLLFTCTCTALYTLYLIFMYVHYCIVPTSNASCAMK